jgi:hypothetical protein
MNSGLGMFWCILLTAVGMGVLAIAVSGLTTPDPAGGLLRTLGGLVAFLGICLGTVIMMLRSS